MTTTKIPVEFLNALSGSEITDGSIATADIANDAITTAKIAANAITATELPDNVITATHIPNGLITGTHMAGTTITATQIADNAVGTGQLAGIARGKIIYGDSNGDPQLLALGSNGQALVTDGTDISWGSAGETNRLPLSGGTLTGNLIVGANIQSNTISVGAAGSSSELLWLSGSGHTGHGASNTVSLSSMSETTSGNAMGLWFGSMTNENTGVIGSRTASGNIAFQTYNGSAWGERLRINSDGRLYVGSGTQAGSAASPLIQINDVDTGIFDGGTNIIGFSTGGTERMRIDASGNVGIEVTPETWTSDYTALQIGGGSSLFGHTTGGGNASNFLGQNVYHNSGWKYINTNEASNFQQKNGAFYFNSAASGSADAAISFSTKMVIDSSGYVGIGTDSPDDYNSHAENLVVASSGNTGITIAAGTSSDSTLMFADGTGGTAGYRGRVSYDHNGDYMYFHTGAAERMRINSDGYVSLNRDASEYGLELKSAGTRSGLVLKKPGTDTIQGSVLLLADESFRLGTASVYNIQMYQNGNVVVPSGKVGIGTSSPQQALHVFQTEGGVGAKHATIRLGGYGTTGAEIAAYRYDGNSNNQGLIFSSYDATDGIVDRMVIQSNGNINVGGNLDGTITTGNGVKLNAIGVGEQFLWGNSSSNSSSGYHQYDSSTDVYRFIVGYGGTIYATSTSISAISDVRLKENIVDLETGLNEVLALKPRRFDWKSGEATNVAGFVAQEVETVLPDLIGDYKDNNIDDLKSVKMGDMLPTLVKAIQEQQEQIEALKTEVEALKG